MTEREHRIAVSIDGQLVGRIARSCFELWLAAFVVNIPLLGVHEKESR